MSRLKILWIPHTPWKQNLGRTECLIPFLSERFELHVITWSTRGSSTTRLQYYLKGSTYLNAIRTLSYSNLDSNTTIHCVPTVPPVLGTLAKLFNNSYPPEWTLLPMQIAFQNAIRKLHADLNFNLLVTAPSHCFTGYPPQLKGVPMILDYLDTMLLETEAEYIKNAQNIITVSSYLQNHLASRYGCSSRLIPNGVFLDRLRHADGQRFRQKYGIAPDKKIVSLIGLTASPRLYFLEAIAHLLSEHPELIFACAGHGPLADTIAKRCQQLDIPTLMTGWVDPQEVGDVFAATNIGLYPGDDNAYYDGACPLKVLEYMATKTLCVTNRSAEHWGIDLSSLIVRPATVEGFVDGIKTALTSPPVTFPDMIAYDWSSIAKVFGDEIEITFATKQESR